MTHFIYMSGEVYSPPSGGMATPPYTDLPSPPTVVADYNRPYDSVSTKGPHLLVTEQPQSKFRFRYKSEMVGTHGQLKAERADKNKAIFPTVKLANWNEGSALIRLALYTGEENCTLRRRHVHELSGKNCDKVTGICEMVVDQTTDYLAAFQNLGIIHIAKREVKEIIKQRKKAALVDHAKLRRPERSHEEIRQSITPTDMKKIDEEAEEVARTMDLNKVVLRFQAFQYDDNQRCYKAVTRFVDSELVVNLKNASTGELKIVRMSGCSAPCTGGSEVWMLVEKVKKSNIRIKFFELDSDGSEVWSAYAEFSEGDVHHQYAIIFKTPPYRSTNLRSSVRVKVQLERINDKDISEPRDFTYHPESLKRQSPFTDSVLVEEDEDYHQGGGGRTKRLCQGSSDHALDLRFSEFHQVLPKAASWDDKHHDQYRSSGQHQSGGSSLMADSDSHASLFPDQSSSYCSNLSHLETGDTSFYSTRSSNDILYGSLYSSEYERHVAINDHHTRKTKQSNSNEVGTFENAQNYFHNCISLEDFRPMREDEFPIAKTLLIVTDFVQQLLVQIITLV